MTPTAEQITRALGGTWNGRSGLARCPAHEDRTPSLSIRDGEDGRLLLKCHAGCEFSKIKEKLQRQGHLPRKAGGGDDISSRNSATAQQSDGSGLTLKAYAKLKKFPVEFLERCGVSEFTYLGKPALRIPYHDIDGAEAAIRFRISADGDKFRWRKGSKPSLYGLEQLEGIREAGEVFIVEGESDAQTLWFHEIPALGLPGAGNWNEQRDAGHFEGIDKIYLVVEPDQGGVAALKWLASSAIRDRTSLIFLSQNVRVKDASALHLEDPDRFKSSWRIATMAALPWHVHAEKKRSAEEAEAWLDCEEIARSDDILGEVNRMLYRAGVVGEKKLRKLLYLGMTTRLFDRPVSILVKGPSSGGKSHLVEQVKQAFPPTATYCLTAMSERALAYGNEPLSHRMLIIFEAAGASADFTNYLVRSLLSEGRIIYETVEKTHEGLRQKRIEREGPTGLIMTTTGAHIHPENETRMLSVLVTDTQEQTRRIMRSQAKQNRAIVDWSKLHAFQMWLALRPCQVVVPYAEQLADLIPPIAVRLRRDFPALLTLIRAHALLHQWQRKRAKKGEIIATFTDYDAIRSLVADIFAQGVEATVPGTIRETVDAVRELQDAGRDIGISLGVLANYLKIDKSSASRRARDAVSRGYLQNKEERKGRHARYVLGDPMPEEIELLPLAEKLEQEIER